MKMSNRVKSDEAWLEFGDEYFSEGPGETDRASLIEFVNTPSGEKDPHRPDEIELPSKRSLEESVQDQTDFAKRTPDEFAEEFKAGVVKTARSILEMCRVVYIAKRTLDDNEFDRFCNKSGIKGSTARKYTAIGKVYPRLIQYVDQLPEAWTSIYLITQIGADDFNQMIEDQVPLSSLKGADLHALVRDRTPIQNISHVLPPRKEGGWVFAKVWFTKKPDDTDWRAMQKALMEIEARLPIRFDINKQAQAAYHVKRDIRYEKAKVEYEALEFKPERWDFGRDANSALPNPDTPLPALPKPEAA
jgi:hypothetical protein